MGAMPTATTSHATSLPRILPRGMRATRPGYGVTTAAALVTMTGDARGARRIERTATERRPSMTHLALASTRMSGALCASARSTASTRSPQPSERSRVSTTTRRARHGLSAFSDRADWRLRIPLNRVEGRGFVYDLATRGTKRVEERGALFSLGRALLLSAGFLLFFQGKPSTPSSGDGISRSATTAEARAIRRGCLASRSRGPDLRGLGAVQACYPWGDGRAR